MPWVSPTTKKSICSQQNSNGKDRKMTRREVLILGASLAVAPLFAAELPHITVSVPGPRNISYLPIDLIQKLGFDKAAGFDIGYIHTGGGSVALDNLIRKNSDFAVAGQPAAMSARLGGAPISTIAPVDDAPLFILMVRSELKGKVKTVADLRGMTIGVNTSSLSSKTTSQQLLELILKSHGVSAGSVRMLPGGQSWKEQSSIINSKTVDAIMGDEPFASRLLEQKKVFFLANLSEKATTSKIEGSNFLHAAVHIRDESLTKDEAKIEKFVLALKKTLEWMATHSAEDAISKLEIKDEEERKSLIYCLKKYPNIYSKNGAFSAEQLRQTAKFFGEAVGTPEAKKFDLNKMIVDKYMGRK
jgi:NitT/TauT family transport system substrate-binding protein